MTLQLYTVTAIYVQWHSVAHTSDTLNTSYGTQIRNVNLQAQKEIEKKKREKIDQHINQYSTKGSKITEREIYFYIPTHILQCLSFTPKSKRFSVL